MKKFLLISVGLFVFSALAAVAVYVYIFHLSTAA